jgi:putative ATP-binding cassette transporter
VRAADEVVSTALLRAIAGLWEIGKGRIVRPSAEEMLILPDRPYLPRGTLRELLVGIDGSKGIPDDTIRDTLRSVGVGTAVHRVGGIDVELDWDDALSLDEQRLVGVARAILAVPRLVVLERPAEGLGVAGAVRILRVLQERAIGCVVLDGSAMGDEHFDRIVEIDVDGAATVREPHNPAPELARDSAATTESREVR